MDLIKASSKVIEMVILGDIYALKLMDAQF